MYVDDILLIGNDQDRIADVKLYLDTKFTIKDLGQADFFLGIKLSHSTSGIFVG